MTKIRAEKPVKFFFLSLLFLLFPSVVSTVGSSCQYLLSVVASFRTPVLYANRVDCCRSSILERFPVYISGFHSIVLPLKFTQGRFKVLHFCFLYRRRCFLHYFSIAVVVFSILLTVGTLLHTSSCTYSGLLFFPLF
jgi:hypothetical protein